MNKKYLTVPAVLAAICVSSALLIGITHFATEAYAKGHQSNETPSSIKALYDSSSVSFAKVSSFETVSITGENTKISLSDLYVVNNGKENVGLAYAVNAGKPVKTEVIFTISFEGDVDDDNLSSFRPKAIYVEQGGDVGYDKNVVTFASYLVDGSASLDGKTDYLSGGTKSQKYLLDGVKAARSHYASVYQELLSTKGAN